MGCSSWDYKSQTDLVTEALPQRQASTVFFLDGLGRIRMGTFLLCGSLL